MVTIECSRCGREVELDCEPGDDEFPGYLDVECGDCIDGDDMEATRDWVSM